MNIKKDFCKKYSTTIWVTIFTKVEIKHIQNHKWTDEKDGKEYIGEVEIIGYFDFNNEPLKERLNIISKKEVVPHYNYSPPCCDVAVIQGHQDPDTQEIKHKIEGAAIGGSIALLASGPIGWTALGVAAEGALFGLLK